jgi:hypothetical protein
MINDPEVIERTSLAPRYYNISEGDDIHNKYLLASEQYPYNGRNTCAGADAQLKAITAQIADMEVQLTRNVSLGSNGHPMRVIIDGYTQMKQEIQQQYYNMYCDSYKEKQENQEFLDSQISQLKQAQSLVKKDSTGTYIVYGIIGAIVIVAGVILLKK